MDENTQRKRVLIIAYQFPPLLGGGTFRPLKFAKYLPQFGWNPIVLCAQPTADDLVDPALLNELPDSVIVERLGYLHPQHIERALLVVWKILWKLRLRAIAGRMEPYKVMRWIVPDPHVTWAVSAYRAARRLVRQYCPEVVMTTTPPHSAQLVGLWLKRATGLPWVADLRDPWTQNPFVVYPTRWHLKADEVWEKQIFQKADYVVSVTEAMTKQFQGLYAGDIARKICTITNGFDPQDFIGEVTESSLDTRLRIVYTGSLYGLNKPDSFLFCIDRLTKEGKIPAERLCVEFIGLDGIGTLKRYADQSWFRHITPQSHHYAVSSMLSASVLLLLLPSELPYAHSGKLFEYLRASRPILALAPIDSEAACLVRAAKAGVVVPPDDPEAISTAVLRMYDEWQSGQLQVAPDPKVVASFDCRRLTQELVNILDWSAGAADSGKDHKVAAQVSR